VVKPLSPFVGAEVYGLDLTQAFTPKTLNHLETALANHGVLFFRDQVLTPEAHINLAAQFGEINVNRFFKAVEAYPQIAEVRKEANHRSNIGGNWHTDHSYDEQPARFSLLYAKEVPELGGDTLFASMTAAFEALSTGLQDLLCGLKAWHSSRHVFGAEGRYRAGNDLAGRVLNSDKATQDALHPVVLTHPLTGKKSLYVNPGFTVGFENWNEKESAALLAYLYAHAKQPEFSCRFSWRPGSLAIWDNRLTWHHALNDYAGERRLMHRITVQ
jgi:taurine dioxygenase